MSSLSLPLPPRFDLKKAVCSYGYFILAPNRWDADTQTFSRPIRLSDESLVQTTIKQSGKQLRIACDRKLPRAQQAEVKAAYTRILRLDEDFVDWYRLHPEAKRKGYARLFRSPTFFEDMVKTITGCNVTWTNTIRMNQLLCEHYGQGGFPSPRKLAQVKPAVLKAKCKVGYRAERIVRLAKAIESGEIVPAWFESSDRNSDELFRGLKAVYGLGDYAAGNMLQLLGHYDRVAIDSETYRHFCKVNNLKRPTTSKGYARLDNRILKHYAQFAPYQFLAYWFELWHGYEQHVGAPADQWREEHAGAFTASELNR